jgi:hypothetical protein
MAVQKRILVVDDEADFAALVQGNLEREGFLVELAYNGEEGLIKVRANPPDAIVLDVMMPEKDGYTDRAADGRGLPRDLHPLQPRGRDVHRGRRLHRQTGLRRGYHPQPEAASCDGVSLRLGS